MRKVFKTLVCLFLLAVFLGAGISVYYNNKRQEKQRKEQKVVDVRNYYKIVRKNNKYIIKSDSSNFKEQKLSNIFYDDRNVYLYLEGGKTATLLKYNVEKNRVNVIFENNSEIKGEISRLGNYYKINNYLYDSNFNKVKEYPIISEGELLFPNLKYKLSKKDEGISKVNLETKEESLYIKNTSEEVYTPYIISNNGKTVIVKKVKDNHNSLCYVNDNGELNDIEVDGFDLKNVDDNLNTSYKLLSNTYLLERLKEGNDILYNIYDLEINKKIYTTNKNYSNYMFGSDYVVYNDKDGSIIYQNFKTGEVKTIIKKDKDNEELSLTAFEMASDNYSITLMVDTDEKQFYIIYL